MTTAVYHNTILGRIRQTGGEMETTIQGIPCSVDCYYSPGRDWKQHTFKGAGPGDCDPPEPEDFEITEVYDRKGYRAPWLAKKLTEADESRIRDEYVEWKAGDY